MKNDSNHPDPNPNKPLSIKPSKKNLYKNPKRLNVYNSKSIKTSIKEFRNMNKYSVSKPKMSQKGPQGIILQVKAPDGRLSIKRLLINNKIPEQVLLKIIRY